MPSLALERKVGGKVAGIDEAGRGPLAGPVLAAAVLFPVPPPRSLARQIDDSKKLTPEAREAAFAALLAAAAKGRVMFGVGAASAEEIGRINILRATHVAMRRALLRLAEQPDCVLVDGNMPPPMPCRVECVIGGDAESLSIAAASILAKVLRDRAMRRLDPRWPGYGFARHVGYATPEHREALARLGPTPHHRRGFAPVDQLTLSLG